MIASDPEGGEAIREFGTPQLNEEYRSGGCGIVFYPRTQKYATYLASDGLIGFFAGGVSDGEDMREGVLREVREESGLYDFAEVEYLARARAHYFNHLKKVNRVADATCYLIRLGSDRVQEAAREAHETFELAWMTPEEILSNWKEFDVLDGRGHWIYFLHKAVSRAQELGWDTTTDLVHMQKIVPFS
jgi:8-oxo-dGTP pyrophosphatase MutT (NUDIX family)